MGTSNNVPFTAARVVLHTRLAGRMSMRRMFRRSCVLIGGLMMMLPCVSGCARQAPSITFGVLADVQYAEKPSAGTRHYAASRHRLEEAAAALNALNPAPAFVIQLGDLIDGGPRAEEELTAVAAIYDRIAMPRYHVLGNHDFDGVTREQTLEILAMDRAYYTFDAGGWRFVVLDTQDRAVQGGWAQLSEPYREAQVMLSALRQRRAANAQVYNGAVGAAQLAWLDAVLAEATEAAVPVIVFGHLTLTPPGESHTLWNAEDVRATLERHACVKAYFCGHVHRGNWQQHNGIDYVSFEAMVDWADRQAVWYLVNLSLDAIVIEGVGVSQSWTLPLTEPIRKNE